MIDGSYLWKSIVVKCYSPSAPKLAQWLLTLLPEIAGQMWVAALSHALVHWMKGSNETRAVHSQSHPLDWSSSSLHILAPHNYDEVEVIYQFVTSPGFSFYYALYKIHLATSRTANYTTEVVPLRQWHNLDLTRNSILPYDILSQLPGISLDKNPQE